MPAPLVSVVMPVYNGERFVVEAVRSIVAQTFADFELLVIDDGSIDRTAALLEAERKADPRIVVHRQPVNAGFKAALDEGCARARGRYIARMDADDISLPARLERQVAFLEQHPDVGAVGSAIQVINEYGARGRTKSYPLGSGLAAWSMVFFNSLAHPATMLRRATFEALGGYPAGCAGGTEDYAIFLEIARISRLANLADVLLLYRMWGGNMTKTKWEAQEVDAVRLLRQFLANAFSVELSSDDAFALRGLSRDEYPRDAAQAARVGSIIDRLVAHFAELFAGHPDDVQAIRLDAGVRLLLLAALAARHGSARSLSLAARALAISPASLAAFAGKVARRLIGPSA